MKVLVVGGGIAGVSAAYSLSRDGAEVTLVEAEPHLAAHSTGRSAALYFENYGAAPNRALTRVSRAFLDRPPIDLDRHPLLSRRGALWVGREDQVPTLRQILAESTASTHPGRWLEPKQAQTIVPVLDPSYLGGAVFEPEALDIDVAALHQIFVKGTRQAGGEIQLSSPITRLEQTQSGWRARAGDRTLDVDVIVNAAGAWGDQVAEMAGARALGLTPMRRTAFMVPGSEAYRNWPLVCDADNQFYFRPDGPQLLCSLAEEKASPAEDARPDPLDIALAIDRINAATSLEIRTVRSSWTGLRSFVPDRAMVIGFDPVVDGFFWLIGQGGTGIQTAPAAADLAAGLILEGAAPDSLLEAGVDLKALSPARLLPT